MCRLLSTVLLALLGGCASSRTAPATLQAADLAIVHATVMDVDERAEVDKVATRKTVSGTHRGELIGIPPIGRRMEIPIFDIFCVVDGK